MSTLVERLFRRRETAERDHEGGCCGSHGEHDHDHHKGHCAEHTNETKGSEERSGCCGAHNHRG